ncbi:hypothetical protein NBRC116188_13320 [Oceaniserpentilla sp. 4NH20-0058]|uniref:hypothetical protein n=1 Tax=Oceaniserpentilla sp. 4NH20-0058 TaxID=3127660 RepID=UPI0031023685
MKAMAIITLLLGATACHHQTVPQDTMQAFDPELVEQNQLPTPAKSLMAEFARRY